MTSSWTIVSHWCFYPKLLLLSAVTNPDHSVFRCPAPLSSICDPPLKSSQSNLFAGTLLPPGHLDGETSLFVNFYIEEMFTGHGFYCPRLFLSSAEKNKTTCLREVQLLESKAKPECLRVLASARHSVCGSHTLPSELLPMRFTPQQSFATLGR